MKLLFHIILIYFFVYVNSQVPPNKTINGCGMVGYTEPQSVEDCKDDSEICCYISLKIDEGTKKFCFPAPEKIDIEDIAEDIKQFTGYEVAILSCNDFSERIKVLVGNLILIGLILF